MGRFSLGMIPLMVCLAAAPHGRGEPKDAPRPVRVTLVVIKASESDEATNPKLATLAKEVRKRNDEFVGFKIVNTLDKSIPLGEPYSFDLPEKQTATVTIREGMDKAGRIELIVKLPGLDDVTYNCVCDKFFPIVTPYKLKTGETILVAILAKPCTGK